MLDKLMHFARMIWNGRVLQIGTVRLNVLNVLEILVLAFILYRLFRWFRNTRTGFLLRGIFVVLAFFGIARLLEMNVIVFIAEKTLSILVIALLIIFQPELRAALESLGHKNYLFNWIEKNIHPEKEPVQSKKTIDQLVDACFLMGRAKTGALIVIEKETPLQEYRKTGIEVDAILSTQLLINIFEKNTPLHDGAVIVVGDRVAAATCYLPLSGNPDIEKSFGTRHRAAIGVSETTDSLTIVVSEETGDVSVAVGGVLKRGLSRGELRSEISSLFREEEKEKNGGLLRRKKEAPECEAEEPEVKDPEVKEPEAKDPEVKDPEAEESEAEDSAAEESGAKDTEAAPEKRAGRTRAKKKRGGRKAAAEDTSAGKAEDKA